MKTLLLLISVYFFSCLYAQKPPLTNEKFYCNAVTGIDDSDFTDKDGISLKYSSDTSCNRYFKGKLYTGKVKVCKNNKIFAISNYVNGRGEGEDYYYYDNGNLAYYRVFGKDTTEGEFALVTKRDDKGIVLGFKVEKECFGVLNGEEIHYHENGKVWFKGFNQNGEREGKWYTYDKDGELMEISTFQSGELIQCSGKCD